MGEEPLVSLALGFLLEPMEIEIVVDGADDLGMGMSNFDGKVDESIEVGADFRLKEKALSLSFEIKILE